MAPRELDLVLVGATGYVGRLAAAWLARRAPQGLRLGLAGRSVERLAAIRAGLGPNARAWPLLTVDVTESEAAAELASRARVVVSAVGPYLRYGLPLVQACAAAGTDYADLTGETLFVRRSIDACHSQALQTGARIVHSCGFDSVPSDLGVGLTAAQAEADGAGGLGRTMLHVRSARGGVSGGTLDSLRQQIAEAAADPAVRRLMSSPYALAAEGQRPEPADGDPRRPVIRDRDTGSWQAPFAMGGYNRQIVMRSASLTGGYGPAFRYREVVDAGPGAVGAARAAAVASLTGALLAGMSWRPTRSVLDRLLPKPGEGPSERTRRSGRFWLEVVAETTSGARYQTSVGTERDPGYDATAVMLGESALCLAQDNLPLPAGVLTPMTALGEALAARLRSQDFTVRTQRLD